MASDDGYKAIASLFDEIPKLNAEIQSQKTELDHLTVKIKSLEATHKQSVQETLEIYCTQRNKLQEEKAQLSKDISTLTTKIQQRDVAATENQRIQDALRGRLDLAKKSLDEEKEKVVGANAAITKLQGSLKGKDLEIDNLKESLHIEKVQASQVKSQLQDRLTENTALKQQLHSRIARLNEIERFTMKLREEDDVTVW